MQQRIGIGLCAAVILALFISTTLTRSPDLEAATSGPSATTPTIPAYLPLILRQPTPTPTPPSGPCHEEPWTALEGAAAAVVYDPIPPGQEQTLCVRLILDNIVIPGATVTAVAHLPTQDTTLGPVLTEADGRAALVFNVGTVTGVVGVDATVIYNEATYPTTTCFYIENAARRAAPHVIACG